jgi:integrase
MTPEWEEDELPRYLLREQVAAILRAAAARSVRDLTALLVTYKYGLRVSELVSLNKSDVRFETARMKVRRAKGSVSKEMPLLADVARTLTKYMASRSDDDSTLIRGPHGRLSRRQAQRIFDAAATAAGVRLDEGIGIHCLRHSIAVHWMEAGRSREEVQDWLGHRSITSTEKYSRITAVHRTRAAEAAQGSSAVVTWEDGDPPPAAA